jgi:cyclopropane-fatty-acyl-phospholipid synthase
MLPSIAQIGNAIEGLFVMEDWHNFGADYDKTLLAWDANFEKHWPELQKKYGDRFYRMWKYYLLSCAALFRARGIQLWQIVLSKNGMIGGYESIR